MVQFSKVIVYAESDRVTASLHTNGKAQNIDVSDPSVKYPSRQALLHDAYLWASQRGYAMSKAVQEYGLRLKILEEGQNNF